jgi:hypothetical protein
VINKLIAFERKIMRKMYGATGTGGGYWGIETDQEISDILNGQHIIGFIKRHRFNWLGHVDRTRD